MILTTMNSCHIGHLSLVLARESGTGTGGPLSRRLRHNWRFTWWRFSLLTEETRVILLTGCKSAMGGRLALVLVPRQ